MSIPTRMKALQKLNFANAQIGYPNELLNDTELDNYYKDLSIVPGSLLKTVLSLNLFTLRKAIEKLRKPNKMDWTGVYIEKSYHVIILLDIL